MNELKSNSNDKLIKISLVLSIIAIIGLLVFVILDLIEKEDSDKAFAEQAMPVISSGSNSLVFVDTDQVLQEYELVTKLTGEIENDRKRKDADFSARQKQYETDAAYFQQQVQQQSISEESAQQIYEQLMLKQQELYEMQDQFAAVMAQKEFEMNMVLLDSIRNYLKRINLKYQYDYILSYNATGNLLFGKDTLNITQQVVEGLNNEYAIIYKPEE